MSHSPSRESPREIWTPKSVLDWSSGFFSQKGLASPRLDAELLLAHVLACRRIDLYLQFDRPLDGAELAAFRGLVQARGRRVPVAYLTGEAGFWNLTLAVAEGCLIPRPETETLIEVALEAVSAIRTARATPQAPLRVAEVGTGSGAIPLAVCSEAGGLTFFCTDPAPAALKVARKNLTTHAALLTPRENRVHLVRGLDCSPYAPGFAPDLLLSNPPYIPTAEVDGLEPEVSRAEPRQALDGGPDGLAILRALITYAARGLAPGGRLVMEIGAEQGDAVRGLLAPFSSLALLEIRLDLAGRERVIHAERRAG